MDEIATLFEAHRGRLRAVAYRMLGSVSDADDAVQETWLRLSRSDTEEIDNVGGWLTTVVARICLNVLRSRRAHVEDALQVHVPDPVVDPPEAVGPEHEALLADAVGLALLTVVQTLPPPERLAFVLHDSFAVPFEDIATVIGTSQATARQLASRGRRKVRRATSAPQPDRGRQRAVVDAFFAAAREGDFDALVAVLHPDVVLRADSGRPATSVLMRGPAAVAGNAMMYSSGAPWIVPALVNGAAGVIVAPRGRPVAVMAFTVVGDRIVAIDALTDAERLGNLDLSAVVR